MRVGPAAVTVLSTLALAGGTGRPADTRFAVGYTTPAALARVLRHASLVRDVAPLQVAEVRAASAASLSSLRGVRYVQPAQPRVAAGVEPAVARTAAPLEWQYHATHTDGVPDTVLRAAAAVEIAVIDTGADVSAPDLAAKAPETWNTRTGTADVRDVNGHGTFVSSLAAGSVTNGDGMAGAGGDARLLVIKAGSDSGAFTDVDEAAALTYAVDHGARIVNLSVGGPTTSATERRGIQYAVDHGALVVAAVGNEKEDGNPVEYPAALLQPVGSAGVGGAGLAVTASTSDGRHAEFANTGSWVSLAAPGERVLGAVSSLSSPQLFPRTTLPGATAGLYGYGSGTSFAAPLVAGAAALVWAANPSLTAAQVAEILKETASGGGTWTPELGFGVVDVAAAVAAAQRGAAGVLLSGSKTKSRVRLNWSGAAASYRLMLETDGRDSGPLLASTSRTSAVVSLAKGHTYSFRVDALNAVGATTATSAPLIVTG
jgi:subtilisin family serine protease